MCEPFPSTFESKSQIYSSSHISSQLRYYILSSVLFAFFTLAASPGGKLENQTLSIATTMKLKLTHLLILLDCTLASVLSVAPVTEYEIHPIGRPPMRRQTHDRFQVRNGFTIDKTPIYEALEKVAKGYKHGDKHAVY